MCFTVAIVREGVLLTTEQYYNNLPVKANKKVDLCEPEIPNFYMVSGFSHPKLPVITDKQFVLKEWGLIPSWVKSKDAALDLRDKTLNAKGETIYEKPSFSQNILSRRCLLPVSGFFEWRDFDGHKYPYYIEPSKDAGFLIGSLYDTWLDKSTGEKYETFSIVTTPANPLLEIIHNSKKRMPLILDFEAAAKWLDPLSNPEQIRALIRPYEESNMKAHTISKLASNSKRDRNYKEILQPVDYPELLQQDLF